MVSTWGVSGAIACWFDICGRSTGVVRAGCVASTRVVGPWWCDSTIAVGAGCVVSTRVVGACCGGYTIVFGAGCVGSPRTGGAFGVGATGLGGEVLSSS